MPFFTELEKNPKIYMEPQNSQSNLEKKKTGIIAVLDFKIH
jgi:hypothetical protein